MNQSNVQEADILHLISELLISRCCDDEYDFYVTEYEKCSYFIVKNLRDGKEYKIQVIKIS